MFPQWYDSIPQQYWKARFRKDFLIGREEALPTATALNWRSFYLDIDEQLARSHGWRNRRCIVKIVKGTAELFLELVAQGRAEDGLETC